MQNVCIGKALPSEIRCVRCIFESKHTHVCGCAKVPFVYYEVHRHPHMQRSKPNLATGNSFCNANKQYDFIINRDAKQWHSLHSSIRSHERVCMYEL